LLRNAFDKGGIVLQDIVNELGRRLDFDVENGLYQGKKTAVGFDGIWRSQTDPDILIEVKTTDYVAISLDKIAVYKDRLCADPPTRGSRQTHPCLLLLAERLTFWAIGGTSVTLPFIDQPAEFSPQKG
jgi:hypothetical protein